MSRVCDTHCWQVHNVVVLLFLPDANLRDGLYHEYKRYGKIMAVRLAGAGPDRYAVVSFKSWVVICCSFYLQGFIIRLLRISVRLSVPSFQGSVLYDNVRLVFGVSYGCSYSHRSFPILLWLGLRRRTVVVPKSYGKRYKSFMTKNSVEDDVKSSLYL